jgi:predicted TIM-barrel fold metal-dependent hydrolase
MIIDSHQHVLINVKEQIEIGRSSGIDKVVLFSTIVHPEVASNKNEFVTEMNTLNKILSGRINPIEARLKAFDELLAALESAPDYFIGFGSCPFGMDIDETADWIENKIIKNKLRGIGEITLGPGMASSIENILSYVHVARKELPVWIHTFNPLTIKDIMQIIGYAKKYNKVRFVFGHAGGSNWLELIDLVQELDNAYVDLSALFTVFSIKYIAECLPERCLFSSDLPYGDPSSGIDLIDKLVRDSKVKENLLGNNAERLLNG